MEDLRRAAIDVLRRNERDGYTAPARGLYTHQHLWDSCFIAIGQRHYDVGGAMGSLGRLLRAQWRNGMIPNIIFEPGWRYWLDRRVWRSWISPSAPRGVATGGISQPPMTAEAVARVGQVLPDAERAAWYGSVCRLLVAYHEWLYRERSGGDGLVLQIHPWETGLDNTPPWLESLRDDPRPWWLDLMVRTGADRLASHLRLDTKYVPAEQRSSTVEALRLYDALRRIRKDKYDAAAILKHPPFAIEDLTYNCILIRANVLLKQIATDIGVSLPASLESAMRRNEEALDSLWDQTAESYFSRDLRTGELLKEQSIAALMPLYAGCIDAARAKRLVSMLADPAVFGARYPVPSVPLGSRWFNPTRYWQGPTWINMNWLIIDGLLRYGFVAEADALRRKTLGLVGKSAFYEYYHPVTGEPAGVQDFSWTAALTIDLLQAPGRPGGAGTG
jgi:mannosylglycerate hydrolase